jgi:hypothetical protein
LTLAKLMDDRLYLFSDIGDSQSLPEFIVHLVELPLLSEPGVRWRYSFSSDVQGAMVERLSGKKLSKNLNSKTLSMGYLNRQ